MKTGSPASPRPCPRLRVGAGKAKGALALIKGMPEDLLAIGSAQITMHLVVREPEVQTITIDQQIQRNAVEIDESTWLRVTTYADRLLVDATETSQLTGAGAGLVDTD